MKLVRVDQIREAYPDLNWPYNEDGTRRQIKLGRLGRIQVGRHYFVTRDLLEQFIADHVKCEPIPVKPREQKPRSKREVQP